MLFCVKLHHKKHSLGRKDIISGKKIFLHVSPFRIAAACRDSIHWSTNGGSIVSHLYILIQTRKSYRNNEGLVSCCKFQYSAYRALNSTLSSESLIVWCFEQLWPRSMFLLASVVVTTFGLSQVDRSISTTSCFLCHYWSDMSYGLKVRYVQHCW